MRKSVLILFALLLAGWVSLGCGIRQSQPKEMVIHGGTLSPTTGVGFDVNYDPRLDNVIPGYKVVTVAYTNNSMNILQMSPEKDSWWIEDRMGKKIKAVIDLRANDPDVWAGLQKKLKVLLEYPLLIRIGKTETIDLLFKSSINLSEFKSVIFKSKGAQQAFKIIPREE